MTTFLLPTEPVASVHEYLATEVGGAGVAAAQRMGPKATIDVVSAAGLIATLFLPSIDFGRGVPAAAGERMLQAEMTNLEPEDEPVAVPE